MEITSCPVCYKEYNLEENQPMSLKCGHSICKYCSSKMLECPICRNSFGGPNCCVPNYTMRDLIEKNQKKKKASKVFCSDCNSFVLDVDLSGGDHCDHLLINVPKKALVAFKTIVSVTNTVKVALKKIKLGAKNYRRKPRKGIHWEYKSTPKYIQKTKEFEEAHRGLADLQPMVLNMYHQQLMKVKKELLANNCRITPEQSQVVHICKSEMLGFKVEIISLRRTLKKLYDTLNWISRNVSEIEADPNEIVYAPGDGENDRGYIITEKKSRDQSEKGPSRHQVAEDKSEESPKLPKVLVPSTKKETAPNSYRSTASKTPYTPKDITIELPERPKHLRLKNPKPDSLGYIIQKGKLCKNSELIDEPAPSPGPNRREWETRKVRELMDDEEAEIEDHGVPATRVSLRHSIRPSKRTVDKNFTGAEPLDTERGTISGKIKSGRSQSAPKDKRRKEPCCQCNLI